MHLLYMRCDLACSKISFCRMHWKKCMRHLHAPPAAHTHTPPPPPRAVICERARSHPEVDFTLPVLVDTDAGGPSTESWHAWESGEMKAVTQWSLLVPLSELALGETIDLSKDGEHSQCDEDTLFAESNKAMRLDQSILEHNMFESEQDVLALTPHRQLRCAAMQLTMGKDSKHVAVRHGTTKYHVVGHDDLLAAMANLGIKVGEVISNPSKQQALGAICNLQRRRNLMCSKTCLNVTSRIESSSSTACFSLQRNTESEMSL